MTSKTNLYRVSYTVHCEINAESGEQALAMVRQAGDIFDSTKEDWAARLADETTTDLVCPHGVRVVQGVNCLCGREIARYSCFVEGCPGNHLSKYMVCSAVEPKQPHKYATHGPCHICGGQPGDAIHAENGD